MRQASFLCWMFFAIGERGGVLPSSGSGRGKAGGTLSRVEHRLSEWGGTGRGNERGADSGRG